MKLYRFLFIISIALLPLLYGCPENKTVTTKISENGSCIRTIGDFDPRDFKGIDSIKNDIPIPIDRSWKVQNVNDTTIVLMKEFKTVDELNELYTRDQSALKMHKRDVSLRKKFRWFHTVFHYREKYNASITDIPITNYVSEAEAEVFKLDDTKEHPLLKNLDEKAQNSLSDNIEERFELWLHDNIYSMAFDDILEVADSLDLINIQKIDVNIVKDTVKWAIDQGDHQMMIFEDDQLGPVDIARLIGKEIGLDSVSISILTSAVDLLNLDEVYENEILGGFSDEYDNQIIMPGLLTDTNAEILNSDTLSWQVGPIKFIDSDFVMFAESKVTNHWAYLVSGFILAIALIIPFLRKKKP